VRHIVEDVEGNLVSLVMGVNAHQKVFRSAVIGACGEVV